MYLVGDLGNSGYFKGCGQVKVKEQITREDLGKAKDDDCFQVINLGNLTFFDAAQNAWVEFDIE